MANKRLEEMTYGELMSLAGENSSRWHADVAAREDLHNLNNAIYAEADRRFGTQSDFATDGSGVWAHSAGNLKDPQYIYDNYERLYGKADSGRRGVGGYRNQSYSEWKQGGEYQALMDTYRQQADTAMQDVLGQLSARTGGLASSYASAAAAQQYNDIMARLETVARQMYEGDRAAAMDEYEINRAAADTAYDRAVYEREYNDAKTQQQKQEEAAAEEAARARVLEYFTGMGGTSAGADEAMRELIAKSGYTDAELAAMENNYATLMALQRQKAAGSGGTKVVGGSKEIALDDLLGMSESEAKAYLLNKGLNSNDAAFGDWLTLRSEGVTEHSRNVQNSIPRKLLEEINYDAEHGMSKANIFLKLQRWIDEGKINQDQVDWIAESFGY